MTLKDELIKLGACKEAVEWVGRKTLRQAWNDCKRGDWMLWYAIRKNVDKKLLVKCACLIARRVLHLVPEGEDRPRKAIEITEAWLAGKATETEMLAAADAAYAAADAAYAAADAAYAAADAAYAAHAAAYAAYAAHDAAHAADAARVTERKAQADIVREIITVGLLEAGVAGKEE